MRVPTPNIETRQWAEDQARNGVDLIDVELAYWLEEMRTHPEIRFRVQTVISDVLRGKHARDMTRWNWMDNARTKEHVLRLVRSILAVSEDADLSVESSQAFPLKPTP